MTYVLLRTVADERSAAPDDVRLIGISPWDTGDYDSRPRTLLAREEACHVAGVDLSNWRRESLEAFEEDEMKDLVDPDAGVWELETPTVFVRWRLVEAGGGR